jgi:hypothetical protein
MIAGTRLAIGAAARPTSEECCLSMGSTTSNWFQTVDLWSYEMDEEDGLVEQYQTVN